MRSPVGMLIRIAREFRKMKKTDLANKIAGVKKREQANITQIATISVAEKAISTIIKQDMSEGYHYKDIYKDAKDRTQPLKDISVLTVGGDAT